MNKTQILSSAAALTVVALSSAATLAARPVPQMKAVLDELGSYNPPPIEKQDSRVARDEPNVATAAASLLSKRGKPTVMPIFDVSHKVIPGPGGDLLLRIYRSSGAKNQPVLVYAHGGGWVIANLDTYDASCRALATMAHCTVVSVAYRQAPEHKFPAAHDDMYAATKWVMANAASLGGNPKKVAIAGESAGGNLAAATCLRLRDNGERMPVYQLLVYPIADGSMSTPSYQENANAKPLNKAMMAWFFKQYLSSRDDYRNPWIALVHAHVTKNLPPATVILAEIDPLRSEGATYGRMLSSAGVPVNVKTYRGVTHEFFGLGALVKESKDAEAVAAADLRRAFR